jgi:hypothetical protein
MLMMTILLQTSAPILVQTSAPVMARSLRQIFFFKGFWAFYLFGPYPNKDLHTTLLALGDLDKTFKKKTEAGRKHAREKQQEAVVAERAATSSSPWKRGVNIQDRIQVVNLAQNENSAKHRRLELGFFALKEEVRAASDRAQLALELYRETQDEKDLEHLRRCREQHAELMEELKDVRMQVMHGADEDTMLSNLKASVATAPTSKRAPNSVALPATENYRTPSVANKVPSRIAMNTNSTDTTAESDGVQNMSLSEMAGLLESDDEEHVLFNAGLRNRYGNEKE